MHLIINTAIFVSLLLPIAALQAGEHCSLTRVEVKQHSDWIQEPSPYNPCPSEVELPNGFDACLGGDY
jgi:hypothetical protein